MQKKNISVTHHDRTMKVTLCLSEKGKILPTVVFSHGFNGRGEDYEQAAELVTEKGINAVYFDFCGGSRVPNETFPSTEMNLDTEKEDLRAVIEYVLKNLEVESLYLFGASHGGLITALLAEEKEIEDKTEGIVLQYPAFCVPDDWRKRFPKKEDIPEVQDLWGIKLGRQYFEWIHDFDVFRHIGRYSKPVLIMHGDKDEIVPISYSERAAALYPNAEYVPFPGEGHGFGRESGERMLELLLRFMDKADIVHSAQRKF